MLQQRMCSEGRTTVRPSDLCERADWKPSPVFFEPRVIPVPARMGCQGVFSEADNATTREGV